MDANEVLEAKTYLRRIGHWPPSEKVNAEKWLEAFAPEHHDHAVALLDAFVYINVAHAKKLLTSGVHSLSDEVSRTAVSYADKKKRWSDFLAAAIFSAPTDEIPNPSDSGLMYLRYARKELGINQEQIVLATELRGHVSKAGRESIIMVDDFAGTGEQFITTWERESWPDHPRSLAELANQLSLEIYYVPLVATHYAIERIGQKAPSVLIRPSHVLTSVYTAIDPDTIVFPTALRATADDFIREASQAANIRDEIYGFHDLALAIAFEDSIPDSCLALLWSEEGGWKPLMART